MNRQPASLVVRMGAGCQIYCPFVHKYSRSSVKGRLKNRCEQTVFQIFYSPRKHRKLACLQSNPIFSTLPAALKSCLRIIIGFQNMPFTLAHPVAVLPFSRCRYCHFPALVIGSLSPDFVYFLHGRAVSGGHGLAENLFPY